MNIQLSRTSITHLRDIPSNIQIDMGSGWNFNLFPDLSIYEIESFIKSIGEGKIFMIVPIFNASNNTAKLDLSSPILIDNKSNSALITTFIVDQWHNCGFNLNTGIKIQFIFKHKRVWFENK